MQLLSHVTSHGQCLASNRNTVRLLFTNAISISFYSCSMLLHLLLNNNCSKSFGVFVGKRTQNDKTYCATPIYRNI